LCPHCPPSPVFPKVPSFFFPPQFFFFMFSKSQSAAPLPSPKIRPWAFRTFFFFPPHLPSQISLFFLFFLSRKAHGRSPSGSSPVPLPGSPFSHIFSFFFFWGGKLRCHLCSQEALACLFLLSFLRRFSFFFSFLRPEGGLNCATAVVAAPSLAFWLSPLLPPLVGSTERPPPFQDNRTSPNRPPLWLFHPFFFSSSFSKWGYDRPEPPSKTASEILFGPLSPLFFPGRIEVFFFAGVGKIQKLSDVPFFSLVPSSSGSTFLFPPLPIRNES